LKRRTLLFFIVIDFVLVCGFLYRWGGEVALSMGQNLSVKFYCGVLNVYMPGVTGAGEEPVFRVYQDVIAAVYPTIACKEEELWYESQEEMTEYESLAVEENRQAAQVIAENQEAMGSDKVDETATETVSETDEEAAADSSDGASEKKATVNLKKLQDFDYLRQTFYQVDNTTTIGKDQLDVDKLLSVDMTVDRTVDGPQILLYHTHSQEGYSDSVSGDASTTVVGVGDYLTSLLEQKGFTVLHHKGEYDVGDRDHAYSNAAPVIEQLLEDNPSIQVVIDLHRDGVNENTRLVTEQNGKKMAKIMFFNGLSRTTAAGDIPYLKNPYIAENLAFSFQMQLAAAEYYPDLTRRIYLKGYRFNMHFCPKSMLVEVGAQTNTFEEAKNAMEPLADLLAKVLQDAE
jgi:stage II sporulation protein P